MKFSKSVIQKRQNRIIQFLEEQQTANVADLAVWLAVSDITIRRDLDFLVQQGLVERYHGGVRFIASKEDADDLIYAVDDSENAIKDAIAAKAAERIQDGDVVFINSSATAMRLLKFLRGRKVVVITNNARAVNVPRDPQVELILTGGEVYGNKRSLIGEFALNTLMKVRATKCVIGVSGVSVKGGITSGVLQETAINQAMLRRCSGDKIIVTDGSKVGIEKNFLSGSISDVTHLITDTSADVMEIERLRARGLDVLTIGPPNSQSIGQPNSQLTESEPPQEMEDKK